MQAQLVQIDTWLAAASEYAEQLQSLNLTENAKNALSDRTNADLSSAYQALDEAYSSTLYNGKSVIGQKLITEGYMLMNQIGEMVRGDEILYSVTIPQSGGYVTWTGNIKEFIGEWDGEHYQGGLVSFSSSRMVLKKQNTLRNQLIHSSKKVQKGSSQGWKKEKVDAFGITVLADKLSVGFKNNNSILNKWSKLNQGNLLEAFSRIYDKHMSNENPNAILAQIESGYLDELLEEAMEETLRNNDPFWTGGDIGEYQLKGAGASVTNLSQLIYQLNKTRTMISAILTKKTISSNSKKTNVQVTAEVEKIITKEIDKLIEDLLKYFGA